MPSEVPFPTSIRLSSQLTKLSKVLAPLLGIPIALTIPFNLPPDLWWGNVISILLIVYVLYLGKFSKDAYLDGTQIRFVGLWGPAVLLPLAQISRIRRIWMGKEIYFHFSSLQGSFLVIKPKWGEGARKLEEIYSAWGKKTSS